MVKRIVQWSVAAGLLLVAPLLSAAAAQQLGFPAPGSCDAWSRAVAAGGPAAQAALTRSWFSCWPIAADALAAALRQTRASDDPVLLRELAVHAGYFEHPLILDAALEVAPDRSATITARAASLLILAAQLGAALGVNNRGISDLLTEPPPAAGLCGPALQFSGQHGRRTDSQPLPADARRRVAGVLDPLSIDATEPFHLRRLAQCLQVVARPEVPPQIDVSGVRLTHLCENDFILYNPTPLALLFTLEVEGTTDRFNLQVEAGEHRRFSPDQAGIVRLIYDGRVIQSAANGGRRCSEGEGQVRRPIDRRAVQLGAEERRGYFVELLVEQLARAVEWAPRERVTSGRPSSIQ